jgi:hypothetical protein
MFNSHQAAESQFAFALAEDVAHRRSRQEEIRKHIDALVLRERGIQNFSARADAWMPPRDELTLCFCRQVATVSLENLTVELLAEWLNPMLPCRAQTVEFQHDCWAANAYKQSLTALQVLTHLKGSMVSLRSVPVVPKEYRGTLTQIPPLSAIPATLKKEGWGFEFTGQLPAFHRQLRRTAGCVDGADHDLSGFWSECLQASVLPPSSVFLAKNGRSWRRSSIPMEFDGYARPPASWYYFLYMCLYCTGHRALVATTIEEDDENIRQLFVENIAYIEQHVGVAPLILWLPHESKRLQRPLGQPVNFTEIHPGVFRPGWRDQITRPPETNTLYDAADHLIHGLATLPFPE